MVTGTEVLQMLIPQGGWAIIGDDYENIQFIDCESISKKEFLDGFNNYPIWLENRNAELAKQKENILNKLGITSDEAKMILL